jgi:hypothetical protein
MKTVLSTSNENRAFEEFVVRSASVEDDPLAKFTRLEIEERGLVFLSCE